jgi:hypothetical protein
MDEIWYILRYAIPSVVVFITAYFFLKEFFRNEQSRRNMDMMAERMRISLPLRLQAYERLVLFLERVSPNSLVVRVHRPGMSVRELQRELTLSIRDEYAHNLTQQVYVSPQAWDLVVKAYEEMIAQINAIAAGVDAKADTRVYVQKILEAELAKSATQEALEYLKSEARKSF